MNYELPPYVKWLLAMERKSTLPLELSDFLQSFELFKAEYKEINGEQQQIVAQTALAIVLTLARAHRIGLIAKEEYNYELEKILYLARWMIEQGSNMQQKAQQLVLEAVYECHPTMVSKLLSEGWSPDWCYDNGTTALIAIVSRRDDIKDFRDIFDEILKYSPNLFLENDYGYNCLIKAIKHGGNYYIGKIIEHIKSVEDIDRFLADVHHKQETQTISQAEYQILFNPLKIKKEKMQLEKYLPLKSNQENLLNGTTSQTKANTDTNTKLLKI